ncbi:hypothetical protein B0J13DRAFT_664873 [Dactylonectria estremocensis]|uniref:Uncharacterized protein n=1 Tax=Dactylonectria estremocensis TaxID=1079267 RepID=A0A9P9EU75_9HYPO|nr:hypothetical protein B0J13DRAFT_664873 [Dactylonectria estremocensis]
MSLPALRPEFDIGMYSALQLATPPATSSPPSYKPPRDGPLELWMSPPQPARELNDHILHAQEIAEDKRIRLRELPATARGYKSKWKKFICYIFRAFEISPSLRRDIYNVPLRSDNVQMMRHILNLASEMVKAREKGDQATVESGEPCDRDNNDEEEEDSQSYSGSDSDSQSENDSGNYSDSDYTDRSDNDSKMEEDRGDRFQDDDDDDDDVMQSGYVSDLRASQATLRLPQGIRLTAKLIPIPLRKVAVHKPLASSPI